MVMLPNRLLIIYVPCSTLVRVLLLLLLRVCLCCRGSGLGAQGSGFGARGSGLMFFSYLSDTMGLFVLLLPSDCF